MSEHEITKQVRDLLNDFRKDFRDERKQIGETVTAQAERTIAAQEDMRKQVVHLTKMTYSLWRNVRGDDPPPPPPTPEESFEQAAKDPLKQTGSQKAIKPLGDLTEDVEETAETIASHASDIAIIHTQISDVKKRQDELLSLQKEQMGKKDEQDPRSVGARILDGLVWVVKEREGQKFAATMIAGLTGLVTALGTTYAIVTGRLPLPTSPVNQPALVSPSPAPALPPAPSPTTSFAPRRSPPASSSSSSAQGASY